MEPPSAHHAGTQHDSSHWLWSASFWLPPNVTWADLGPDGSVKDAAQFNHLAIPWAMAIVILIVRFALERGLFRALGLAAGLSDRRKARPADNPVLEAAFRDSKNNPAAVDAAALSKRVDMSERQVERWLRQRAACNKASKLDKFCESGWRATYYTGMYVYGWVVLWDKAWFWNIIDCWFRYPNHALPADIWLYYMLELAFYWSLLFSQFFDVKRSDFWEMFLHHVATILLLSLSWTCNLFRVGTLVLWVHDCADVFLESAKVFKYAGWESVSNGLFYTFAGSWLVTRLGYFPTWIIYSITVEAGQFIQYFPAYNVFSGLLSILLVLNLFWSYYIFKVAYLAFFEPSGKIERDLRSASDTSD